MKKMNFLFFLIVLFLCNNLIMADTPKIVSTFECISLYWSPEGGADSLQVLVKYRPNGTDVWYEGLPMKYNPIGITTNDLADYRGSIVNLTSNTTYEIELSLEDTSIVDTVIAKTWSEDFPIAKTIKVGDRNSQLVLLEEGTEDGYILYDGSGSTIDVGDSSEFCIYVVKNYVIIRGFTLKNARESGIFLKNCHNVIIENCDISGWGEEDNNGWGKNYQAGVYSVSAVKNIVVQRCKIHHPRWDSNSWDELNDGNYHPSGPQGIAFYNSQGNHVFRYNEIWTDKDHMFNDIIGYGDNASYTGSPYCDTDIYGNYLSHCQDDGIEAEGADRNVRIWGNYIEKTLIPISNAPVTVGPLYIWKNTSGAVLGKYSAFIKMGYSTDDAYMRGYTYVFNNTILQPPEGGFLGVGKSSRIIRHCVTRNNVLHTPSGKNSISTSNKSYDYDYDYDLCSGKYPEGQEQHGINGIPEYIYDARFDTTYLRADFFLKENSLGYDSGTFIPNFSDGYLGSAPDMGAFESGMPPTEYGVNAYLTTAIRDNSSASKNRPEEFYVFRNYPNPFNPSTKLEFNIPKRMHVKITIYDLLGKVVTKITDDYYNIGTYNYIWTAKDNKGNLLANGLYIARMDCGEYSKNIKLILLK